MELSWSNFKKFPPISKSKTETLKKFIIFSQKKVFPIFSQKEAVLIFLETKAPKRISYIL